MANLTQSIQSGGILILVGSIIVLSTVVTGYFGYSVKNKLVTGYDKDAINTTDPLERGYEIKSGGTRRKKNKSRKK